MIISRDERQEICIRKWLQVLRATIEAVTGFGKTRIATKIINLMRRKDSTRKVIVVVPTEQLQLQWIEVLSSLGLLKYTEVYIINSLIKLDKLDCHLLILDEIHRYAADTFSQVFGVVNYKWILGLTATLKRLDGKEKLLEKYAPIIDKVTLKEAKLNNWITRYKEFNLGLEMDNETREAYNEANNKFQAMFGKFNQDFELMMKCSMNNKPRYARGKNIWFVPETVTLAKRYGWTGNSPYEASQIMKANESRPRGQKVNVWGGNLDHPYHPDKLHGFAINGMRLLREMKDIIHNSPAKIQAAYEVISLFPDKECITFGETTVPADKLKEKLGKKAVVYHSNLEPITISVKKKKEYKTERGVDNWIEKHPECRKVKRRNKFYAVWHEDKKVSANKQKQQALHMIENNPNVTTIVTAKALDVGFDYPPAELGVSLSRTSNPTQQVQRIGRIARLHEFEDNRPKEAIMVNIYLKDTKDFFWLQKAQKSSSGIMWVDSVEEIKERLEGDEVKLFG